VSRSVFNVSYLGAVDILASKITLVFTLRGIFSVKNQSMKKNHRCFSRTAVIFAGFGS
jgi:hypothetical protein